MRAIRLPPLLWKEETRASTVPAFAHNSCVLCAFFFAEKKDSFYHLDRKVHYCVKFDRMTSSRGRQFWPICAKTRRVTFQSRAETSLRRVSTRNKIGCKKRIDSTLASRYHRNFISRNIDGKDITRFCSRCCWTCLQSAVDVDASTSHQKKGSLSFNEITRAFRWIACRPLWNLSWQRRQKRLRSYEFIVKHSPRDRGLVRRWQRVNFTRSRCNWHRPKCDIPRYRNLPGIEFGGWFSCISPVANQFIGFFLCGTYVWSFVHKVSTYTRT